MVRAILLCVAAALSTAAPKTTARERECWGAKRSEVYHTDRSCPAYKRIEPKNLVTFPSEEAAKKDGRKLCKKC